MRRLAAVFAFSALLACQAVHAAPGEKWVTSWAASVQGPYPVGNPSAQPDLRLVFPNPAQGARDQSFRLIVHPDIWGDQTRIRLSNALGKQPVTLDDVHVGLQLGGAEVLHGTNRPVTFGGKRSATIAPGASVWSDAVSLPFVATVGSGNLEGRNLAVSFHVKGQSGPMTWHAKALTTSYVTLPGGGARGASEAEADFPFATASWYFLDAVDMMAPADARVEAMTTRAVRLMARPSTRRSCRPLCAAPGFRRSGRRDPRP